MRLRYILYTMLLLLLSLLLVLYMKLGDTKARLESRERELMKLKAELSIRKANIEEFKRRIREEGIKPLSEREALDRLFNFLDSLKGSYDMKVTRDIRKEGSVWVVDVKLSFRPVSSEEIADRLRSLSGGSSPLIDLKGVLVHTQPEPYVEIEAVLMQPFLGS